MSDMEQDSLRWNNETRLFSSERRSREKFALEQKALDAVRLTVGA
jgi:hypothetical protein